MWHGPVGDVLAFFTGLGFLCPPRKDVPSFLQEVLTESGQLQFASDALLRSQGLGARSFGGLGKRFVVPIQQIEDAFWASPSGKTMQVWTGGGGTHAGSLCEIPTWLVLPPLIHTLCRLPTQVDILFHCCPEPASISQARLERPFDKTLSHPAALKQRGFALPALAALGVVMQRQMVMITRNPGLIVGRMVQVWRGRCGEDGAGVEGGGGREEGEGGGRRWGIQNIHK